MRKHELIIISIVFLLLATTRLAWAEETKSAAATDTNATTKAKLSDEESGNLLQEAIMLARVGLYDEAEARCKQILEQKPDQPTVNQLLREIQAKRGQIESRLPGADLKRKLGELIIPELTVRAADAANVIEFLRAESKKLTTDKSEINFVWQVPPNQELPKVTLNLKNIPMLDVIRYVTTLAKLSYRIDSHAVVIYFAEPSSTSPASPAPADPNVKSQ
jgi:hypothetical protein